MIVRRSIHIPKPGKRAEAVALLKATLQSLGLHAFRIYGSRIGPTFGAIALEIEYESLAELEKTRLLAQREVIEAEKANDLLSAEKDLEINQVRAEAALSAARAEMSVEIVLAELYAGNPSYAYLQAILANATALTETDKIIFTPEGTMPTIVIPGPGIMPTVESSPVTGP